jgi:DNA-directed RNA polymerase I subunit RPA1
LFLNVLSRLFTAYLQYFSGHSCRTEDLILTAEAEVVRKKLVQKAYNLGARAAKAWADSEGGKVPIPPVAEQPDANRPLRPVEKAATSAKIGELLSGNEGPAHFAALDGYMQGQLNPLASEIVKKTLPSGLVVPFPFNTFGIMTTTGAKGSIVNQSQVICSLGQQALEGRRVPRLSSGRTLPSFAPYDPNPRADGFVMDRFLTGVRPQEYYFHCMAGREGLVDTAVKTSRSGYLQRCLMKHLEELKICYDFTVRNAEGSVVQFRYGEDALDPTKAGFLDCSERAYTFLARNYHSLKRHNTPLPSSMIDLAAADASRDEQVKTGSQDLLQPGSRVLARKLREGSEWKRGNICVGWFRAIVTKSHSSRYVDLEYLDDGALGERIPLEANIGKCGGRETLAVSSMAVLVKAASFDPLLSSTDRQHTLGVSGACISEAVASSAHNILQDQRMKEILTESKVTAGQLSELIGAKYSSSLCAPGEAVGSIAAQSIGEPSTQMTLNTFHLAGAGANVTLGIPRLREIIMTASRNLNTPTMSVPLDKDVSEKEALKMTRAFTKLTLAELIASDHGVTVTERLEQIGGGWCRSYYVKIKFHPAERIQEAFGLDLHDIAAVVASNYVPLLAQRMKKELKRSSVEGDFRSMEVEGGETSNYVAEENAGPTNDDGKEDDKEPSTPRRAATGAFGDDDDEEEDQDDADVPGEEDGADVARYRRRAQSVSYEDDDEEDNEEHQRTPTQAPVDTDTDDVQTSWLGENKEGIRVNEKENTVILQPLRVDPATRPLLMVGLVETAATSTVIRSKRKIDEGFVNDEDGRGRCLQTAGVNFEEIWELSRVDHNRLMSNDIWAMRNAYGVEAAANSIVEQIRSVFGVYGITVDPRHLSLIADYMTFEGGYKAMNRIGMEETSSAFLQMSYETTVHFLKQAALAKCSDLLSSPSANIVVGRPIRHGTGSFTVLAK